MGLQLKYNGYTFDTETTLTPLSRQYQFDAKGRRTREIQNWNIRTTLRASGESNITTAIAAMEGSLVDGYDLTLYESDGTTETPHKIVNADQIAGVQITSIAYPESTGPEYAVQRVASINFTGTKEIDTADNVLNFQESVRYWGGGFRKVWHETISGRPKGPYQVAEHTLYNAVQRGSTEVYGSWPTPPAPLFPGFEMDEEPILEATPRYQDGQVIYTVRWEYKFQSAFPLTEYPNAWL